jgi:uncharacterized 2Fe-2S/4Fe-4S cluster protein (DUF4445 family)
LLNVTEADRGVFTADQLAQGWRLACQARAFDPLVIECGQWQMEILADTREACAIPTEAAASGAVGEGRSDGLKRGLGVAIDVGTTTIAAQLVDASGAVLAIETSLNPQAAFGSDVMSRIRAVREGHDLVSPIRFLLGSLVARLVGTHGGITQVLLVGNTVMHHLFSGLDVEALSHVPFESPNLGEQRFTPGELGWDLPEACIIRFVRCIGGFVGSDILAGIVASGIVQSKRLSALVDLGTNGEIAIGNRHGVVCASAAAGPAFEAGAIRMGMRAITGAIAHVALENGDLQATVIGDVAPRGICGSGLVDAVAAGLRMGRILASGRVADRGKLFPVAPPVVLYQADIRELQLAKAAIAAGFRLLLKRLGANVSDLAAIYLAGAFGNYVQVESAIRVGLLEAPYCVVHAAGNTALRGAKMLLLADREPALPTIEHVSLAADPGFQDEFAGCMAFPEPS